MKTALSTLTDMRSPLPAPHAARSARPVYGSPSTSTALQKGDNASGTYTEDGKEIAKTGDFQGQRTHGYVGTTDEVGSTKAGAPASNVASPEQLLLWFGLLVLILMRPCVPVRAQEESVDVSYFGLSSLTGGLAFNVVEC